MTTERPQPAAQTVEIRCDLCGWWLARVGVDGQMRWIQAKCGNRRCGALRNIRVTELPKPSE